MASQFAILLSTSTHLVDLLRRMERVWRRLHEKTGEKENTEEEDIILHIELKKSVIQLNTNICCMI